MATRKVVTPSPVIYQPSEEEEELFCSGMDFAASARKSLDIKVVQKERLTINLEDEFLNHIFGNGLVNEEGYTLRSGQIVEIRGAGSSGKSSICAVIAGKLLRAGCVIHWMDFERFWNDVWMNRLGLPRNAVSLYEALSTDDGIMAAEDLIAQLQEGLKQSHKVFKNRMQVVFVDSFASMMTRMEIDGWGDRNMKIDLAATRMIGQFLKWANWTLNEYNACLIGINQTRINPMAMFKNPNYSAVGGESIQFFPSVRLDFHREAKRFVDSSGMEIGIKGYVHAFKQRQGGGEGYKAGYRLSFQGDEPLEWFKYKKKEV